MWEDWSSENSYVNPLGRFEDGSEHRWTPEGLPVVQKTLTYGELLSDIRDGKVRELVRWDSLESHTGGPDMRCLVVYMDKSVARAKAPSDLHLLNEAMRQHNVKRVHVMMDPTRVQQANRVKKVTAVAADDAGPTEPQGILSKLQTSATQVVSIVATALTGTVLIGVVGWLKYQETTRGDFGDRMKIRIMEQVRLCFDILCAFPHLSRTDPTGTAPSNAPCPIAADLDEDFTLWS